MPPCTEQCKHCGRFIAPGVLHKALCPLFKNYALTRQVSKLHMLHNFTFVAQWDRSSRNLCWQPPNGSRVLARSGQSLRPGNHTTWRRGLESEWLQSR